MMNLGKCDTIELNTSHFIDKDEQMRILLFMANHAFSFFFSWDSLDKYSRREQIQIKDLYKKGKKR